jgi:KAP family P-loop domain
VLLAVGGAGWLGKALTALGPAVVLGGTALNAVAVLRSKASGGLADLVQPVTSIQRLAGEQLAGAYDELVESPDYRRQTGSLYLVQSDIQRVLDLVATPERPLVVFVDDLDRCSPGTVVQVIEAINLFVAGAYPNSIFVIAMEPEMVAAHVEAVYGDLVQKLEQTSGTGSQAFDLGWRFLEKIVQLPLALPGMEPGRTAAFYESLFPREVAQPGGSASRDDAPRDAQPDDSGAPSMAAGVRPQETLNTARRPVTERRLSIDDPEVREAIDYASPCLHRNPREIKRFVNLFRFFTMIYDERRAENLPTPASLHEVAKLAVLGIRWPGLLSTLALSAGDGGDRTIFEVLEDPPGSGRAASKDAALKRTLNAAGLTESTVSRVMAPELRAFLQGQPKVGPGVRGYL